jgi:hypothetical protein
LSVVPRDAASTPPQAVYRHPLTAEQAHLLLAALALSTEPDSYLDHRETHLDAEHDLKRAGLIHPENGPHQPSVGPDVHFSLRYFTRPRLRQGPLTSFRRIHWHRFCATTDKFLRFH